MRKIIFLIFVVISFLGSSRIFAEDNTPAAATNTAQTASAVAQNTPPPVVLKNVTAIEVKGNKDISTNVIVSKLKTRIGSVYQENIISDDLKRLYLLGFFSDIKIDTQDYKDGLKVIIKVTERPIIDKITFSGINRITMKDEKLKQQLKSKEKQYLDYPSLGEDVSTIRKMYEKIGYSAAVIDYKVDIDAQANKAKVGFNVVEGQKVRIKDVLIEGNQAFTAGRILKLLKTRRAWFFNAGVLKEEVLKEDVERLKAFYQDNGYTDVTVESSVQPDSKQSFLLFVYIKIQEGKKYLVGSVSLQGNKEVAEKDILKVLNNALPGKVYSSQRVKNDIVSVQGIYFDRGYIAAQVQDTTIVNPQTGRVDVTYNITENNIVYVEKIKIRGNIKTKDVVIRREMRIHPGERFDGDKLRRSKERLQNLGFFEEVSYDTEEASSPEKKNLIVDVKETKTGAFSFGGGYSTVDKLIGFVEVEQKNFDWRNWPYFTGAGQNLKAHASIGSVSNGFELSFTEPWMFDYPVSFGFDLYRNEHKRDADVGYGYDERVTGGDLRLGKELSEYLKGDLVYRLDEIDITNINSDASTDLQKEYGKNTISSLTPSLTYDSRDNVFNPRNGNLFSGSLKLAGGPIGGNKEFIKFSGSGAHYFPMPAKAVLEIRGNVGMAEANSSDDRMPIYERFFAGGAYSVRGYKERSLGPQDSSGDPLGGSAMLVGNIEYTFPLFDFLKAAAFFDIGNVWDKLGDIGTNKDYVGPNGSVSNSGGFKAGYGLGLRIKTPIGPIMLDYGIPLNKEPGKDTKGDGRFTFSASHGF